MYIDFLIKAFLWICCLFSRSSGFRICQSSSSKTEKLSCISRASCGKPRASKKMHLGEVRKGTPEQMITSLERKLAKYQRNLSTQRRRNGRQCIAVKERQEKARSVMSRSSSSTSSSDSSDWKKAAQVHCCWEIEGLVVLLADLMIVRQVCFLFTRRGVTQGNALFGRFWEQTFRPTVICEYEQSIVIRYWELPKICNIR